MNKKIVRCRICGNENLVSIVNLGFQKLTGVFPTPEQEIGGGELELVKCMPIDGHAVCGLVQLRHSCNGSDMYGENYGYRSGLNASMVNHLHDITREIKEKIEIKKNDLIIDIGSNDCTLLKSYEIENVDYVGMDPTGIKFAKYYPESVKLVSDFFSADNVRKVCGDKKAKVITSIAMFYDLEDPISFARDIAEVLAEDGIWVMEQSYLPFMLQTNSYDTICQEHLEFYCLKQIEWIVEAAGLKVINLSLNDVNGGSFRLTIAHNDSVCGEGYFSVAPCVEKQHEYEKEQGFDSLKPYAIFKDNIEKSKEALLSFIAQAHKENKTIYGYGASTKGNVLLQYCGITSKDIVAIAEVNEDKFGRVTPGTGIPIISEEEAREGKPDYFLVLPWHFRDNILEKEKVFREKTGCKFVFPLPVLEIV